MRLVGSESRSARMTGDTKVVRSEEDYFRIADDPSGIRKNNLMFECLSI
jgi:hypothetical protein